MIIMTPDRNSFGYGTLLSQVMHVVIPRVHISPFKFVVLYWGVLTTPSPHPTHPTPPHPPTLQKKKQQQQNNDRNDRESYSKHLT